MAPGRRSSVTEGTATCRIVASSATSTRLTHSTPSTSQRLVPPETALIRCQEDAGDTAGRSPSPVVFVPDMHVPPR